MPTINRKAPKRKREFNPYNATAQISKIYNTATWRKLRYAKLQDNPLCENCLANDKITPATEVHHKQFISSGDSFTNMQNLGYSYDNLISLCSYCHSRFHAYAKKNNQNYIDYLKL